MKKFFLIIRSALLYFVFGIYMVCTFISRIEMFFILKTSGQDAADNYAVKKAHNWGKFIIKLAGLNVRIIGKENLPKEQFLLVGNHQSFLDIPVLLGALDRPLGFVAKKEMGKVPVLRFWMKSIHCVFMDRDNVREAIKAINQGVEYLKKGYSMVIFPEGTRSKGKEIKEFKKGSLKLGLKADVPIIPITIEGTYRVLEGNHGLIKSADIMIKISQPIDVNSLSKEEISDLSESIRQIVVDNREKLISESI